VLVVIVPAVGFAARMFHIMSLQLRTHSVCEGNTMRRRVGHARCHSTQSPCSSDESALPTPSIAVGERSRKERCVKAFSTEERPARILCMSGEIERKDCMWWMCVCVVCVFVHGMSS